MAVPISVTELATRVGGELRRDGSARITGTARITGVADILEAGASDATWVSHPKFADKLATSQAGVALVPRGFGAAPMPVILCARVDIAVAKLLAVFAPEIPRPPWGVHPTAVVDPTAVLDPKCAIGPHVVIEAGARVGEGSVLHAGVYVGSDSAVGRNCVLWPNVTVFHRCAIGDGVVIHSGSVIGADGFGYYFEEGRHHKVPHIGGVRIEDDVEIGACSCVDRAKFGFTVVGRGTKIDNLVQIAHNCRIGEHGILAGTTALAGSVRSGPYAVFAGRVSVVDHVRVGARSTITATSLVTKDVPDGATVSGYPAQDHRDELRQQALARRLPELMEQVKQLRARVEQLEAATHHRA